ncbi:MAG: hemerythrin domain-containing protein [Desulfarculus sp.]|nr:hemerythrin domain-containing protein [Pseudomonadota bacterium]MBU4600402.1 hemerythrin domain-containing protein [Pseudomonadota bacterium]MBV1714307.1 hemerythrin domain-containing protein [Desulfarculus sp.]MBV1737689.1 hemerythrin domain-containing protein [Desulfarculus sp.]MCG2765450.1 hemerythrin domain-containing protein [Desulfarculaceae bacterium]
MKPSDEIIAEHEAVLKVLDILGIICDESSELPQMPLAHIEYIIDFFSIFVDKCHHGKEEDILFPELYIVGTPRQKNFVGFLIKEHQKARVLVQEMLETIKVMKGADGLLTTPASEAAADKLIAVSRSYINLMRFHINNENQNLLPLIEKLFSRAKQDEFLTLFEQLESERIGNGLHQNFHNMINKLSLIYFS